MPKWKSLTCNWLFALVKTGGIPTGVGGKKMDLLSRKRKKILGGSLIAKFWEGPGGDQNQISRPLKKLVGASWGGEKKIPYANDQEFIPKTRGSGDEKYSKKNVQGKK